MTGGLLGVAEQAFARHETFHPRYGWLQKGVAAASQDPEVFAAADATVRLGVGKNMVNAIRYWGLAFKVLKEAPNPARPRLPHIKPSAYGEALLGEGGWDPYLEDAASLWLLHWWLLRPPSLAPAWWVAFNALAPVQFSEAQVADRVSELVAAAGWPTVMDSSIKKDVDCILRMYAAGRHGRRGFDDVLDCPFRELGLVESVAGEARSWRFAFGEKPSLPDPIVTHACLDYAARVVSGAGSISIARLAADPGGPGCAFKLTEAALYTALQRAAAVGDTLEVTEASGVRQLVFRESPAKLAMRLLSGYYQHATGSTYRWFDADDGASSDSGETRAPARQSRRKSKDIAKATPPSEEGVVAGAAGPLTSPTPTGEPSPTAVDGPAMESAVGKQTTASLGGVLGVRQRFLRSANVERDSESSAGMDYIPTERALEVLRRIVRAMREPFPTRAWSLTGPYGAGKSSFALFLDALLGPDSEQRRTTVDTALRLADPELFASLRAARVALGIEHQGFIRAVVAAQREPATATAARALAIGARRYWPNGYPAKVTGAVQRLEQAPGDARRVGELLACLATHAPVLVVVDEFGKNLEHFADVGSDADLFVLQELAERASGPTEYPAFLITLQHLAHEDYVSRAPVAQRREWSKVQGRFEDFSFIESDISILRLVTAALDRSRVPAPLEDRITTWADAAAAACEQLGLGWLLAGGREALVACYPLHPVVLAVLPELCARYGQHGRTLFSFLSSGEPHSLAAFLAETSVSDHSLPVLGLDWIYDYFVESVGTAAATSGGARLVEVATRLHEAQGLDLEDARCLKTIGLLNLVSQAGALRASAAMVAFALNGHQSDKARHMDVQQRVRGLERRGFLTYRAFADEYRLWEGTDVDLQAAVAASREQLRGQSPAELLRDLSPVAPIVAGRHTQRVGMLRYFDATFADTATNQVIPPSLEDPPDGLLVYFLGEAAKARSLQVLSGTKPVVVAATPTWRRIAEAALELAAVLGALERREVAQDRVARRELQEWASLGRRRLAEQLAEGFGPAQQDVHWYLPATGDQRDSRRGISRLLSELCDEVYGDSPEIRNEMLGRRELTSQGAKARRELLEAMIRHGAEAGLGLEGFGPERAMYEAVLRSSGLHHQASDGHWEFGPPTSGSTLGPAWQKVNMLIDQAVDRHLNVQQSYEVLQAAPLGMKDGPIPVLLTAVLLHRHQDVAVYQEGTYQPSLTPDLIERLMKAPDRFSIKRVAVGDAQQAVLEVLASVIPPAGSARLRNASVLALAAPLIALLRSLPEYTRRTSDLSQRTRAVREALVTAREPDDLLFNALPTACGFPEFPPHSSDSALVRSYAKRLKAALDELRGAYGRLRHEIAVALAAELGPPAATLPELRADLRAQARRLDGQVLDPRLGSFLNRAADGHLDDDDWVEALALIVGEGPPAVWRDGDLERFRTHLHDIAGRLKRVEALHFDMLAEQRDGFAARRVTVTAGNGAETSTVVWVDDSRLEALSSLAETAIVEAQDLVGPQGTEALLAVLAQRLEATAVDTPVPRIEPARKRIRPTSTARKEHSNG